MVVTLVVLVVGISGIVVVLLASCGEIILMVHGTCLGRQSRCVGVDAHIHI